ncbi:MAG: dihydropyrimidine dehydrogenase subunit A [Phycisphaerae bacterium]|jgi:glutamate synthase (NADPH/NADH) small chain|nr:MAG: dihydropyrimidine dehydrogenase subunit A [Phycisphaerae bacterium]
MGKPTGFKEFVREMPTRRSVELRVMDYSDVYNPMPEDKLRTQGARCMDCGVPYCNNGCPLGNIIPEFNDFVYRGRFRDALDVLLKTNNFPEFTGQVCPAPCEEACTLNIWKTPVTIKLIEWNIINHAWKNGWMTPRPPSIRTGKKVAVIGSGPAGLATAAQLNKAGHWVTVFERADRIGGLLTYGIPNFKLEKWVVDRRIKLMESEGIKFLTNANVGFNVKIDDLRREFDAICICIGSTTPRDLPVPGRELSGIHFAMDFLPQQTQKVLGDEVRDQISAQGKHVVVIGGGDTGADCVGTSVRQGAKSVRQIELLPKPPADRTPDMPWPYWPMILRVSTSHEEAADRLNNRQEIRDWSINTKRFSGENGVVKKLHAIRLEWTKGPDGRMNMTEVPGSDFELDCDLCLLAMGFVGPEKGGLIEQLGLKLDPRGNILVNDKYETSTEGVFAAGDARRGQSLVVWALSEGRCAAAKIDEFLMGRTDLPHLKLF